VPLWAAERKGAVVTDLTAWLPKAVDAISAWQEQYGPTGQHPSLAVDDERLARAFEDLTARLQDNYPFFSPRDVGQMLKPPHPAAVLGYLTAMLINPNNHALDGGPATAAMEKDVVARLAIMFAIPQHLGHLTSSGTIANLEALFVARELNPGKSVAYSADAHYTHQRMCHVLGIEGIPLPTDTAGRMDLESLSDLLASGRVGTVVATLGTTGLGALDPLPGVIELARQHGARVHVDTAYGGFFSLIADDTPEGVASAPFAAIADADSIVIDPHKHGLQPYGCGAVLFADPAVGRLYKHDSPYTYFSSDELHLGEISLECSRAGAAAAALWLTLEVLPLTADGLGAALRPGRRGALQWHRLLQDSSALNAYQVPELDIVTYLPARSSLSEVDEASERLFREAAEGPPARQVHIATYSASAEQIAARSHGMTPDVERARILRSVVMKPDSEAEIPSIHAYLEALAQNSA
jgi:glutamate/tyrosine decarboxylase-like PLP-dependent enzyme